MIDPSILHAGAQPAQHSWPELPGSSLTGSDSCQASLDSLIGCHLEGRSLSPWKKSCREKGNLVVSAFERYEGWWVGVGRSRGTTEQLAAMCGTQLLYAVSLLCRFAENVNVLHLVTFTGWLGSFKDFGFQAATFKHLCWEPFITSLIPGRPLSAHYIPIPASISCHNSHIYKRWLPQGMALRHLSGTGITAHVSQRISMLFPSERTYFNDAVWISKY